MPIYEYRCESCGAALEKIRKFSDPPLTDCPACGKSTLKKLVSASSFRLKGSGWYETDFKNSKKNKKPDDDGKTATDKVGNDDSKQDNAADKAPAAKPAEPASKASTE
jgi:putative FmdB family regulatory protein